MIINTNMASNNTIRQLGINQKATSDSLAKLSSGLRINSAADDAAGLAISEKMRGQISGLNQASRNAQTGINLASTAEGALNETTSILQRMRELAVQGSNGTNTTDDNAAMSDEFNQLKTEIDRIGNTTQFNTKNLLDGSLAGASGVSVGQNTTLGSQVGKLTSASVTASASMSSAALAATADFKQEKIKIDGTDVTVNWQNLTSDEQSTVLSGTGTGATADQQNAAAALIVSKINDAIDQSGSNVAHISGYVSSNKLVLESGTSGITSAIKTAGAGGIANKFLGANGATGGTGTDKYNGTTAASGAKFNFNINGVTMQATLTAAITGGSTTMAAAATQLQTNINTAIGKANTASGAASSADQGYIANVKVNATNDGRFEVVSESGSIDFKGLQGTTTVNDLGLSQAQSQASGNGGMTFQIGANAGQTLTFGVNDMRTSALGLSSVNVDSQTSAASAITAIDAATSKVSAERSKLGAIQNRLEHTINNLGTSSQNITSAEANIRDVDMASEMTNFQKNNILQQAAQAMLAQANQQPQGVLQLLR